MAEPEIQDPTSPLLLEGHVFHGRYEVARCLRSGGMGAVYEVVDLKTRRRRALKVMLPRFVADTDLRARFRLEATITAEIESDHIVETLDADVDAETGAPFVVMDLLKGEDLGVTLARRGALPADEVVELLRQAARALDRTHAAGVVHRDLKPANLFLTRSDDGEPKIKVLDFGIAKIVADSGTPLHTTCAMGTPFYMPPEQIRGDGSIGPRADLYALAHLAYTLLSGEPYWKEDRAAAPGLFALFNRILRGPDEVPTARALRRCGQRLPPAFDGWFAKATALRAEDRFETAQAQIAALALALALRGGVRGVPGVEGEAPPLGPPSTRSSAVPYVLTPPTFAPPLSEAQTIPDALTSPPTVTSGDALGGALDEAPAPGRSRRAARWLAGVGVVAGIAVAAATVGMALLPRAAPSADAAAAAGATASAVPLEGSGKLTTVASASTPLPEPRVSARPETAAAAAASTAPSARGDKSDKSTPRASRPPARSAAASPVAPVATARRGGYDPTDIR